METAIMHPPPIAVLQAYLEVENLFESRKVIFKHLFFKNFCLF